MLPFYDLIDAIKRCSVSDAARLLNQGVDVGGRDLEGNSLLCLTEKYGANDIVPMLVRAGASLDERHGHMQDTLLIRAARRGNVGFARAILECGASLDLKNRAGDTALHVAANRGEQYMVRLLLKSKTCSLERNKKGETALDLALTMGHSEIVNDLKHHFSNGSIQTTKHTKPRASTIEAGTHAADHRPGFER